MRRAGQLVPTSAPALMSSRSSSTALLSFPTTLSQQEGDVAPPLVAAAETLHQTMTSLSLPSSSSSSSSSSSLCCCVIASVPITAQRFLRVAKSPIGYHIRRRGQSANHWPFYRRPFNSNPRASALQPVFHWRQYAPYDPNRFLPKENFITGPWTGLFVMPLHQVYTLQHCLANVPIRVRRFPTTFEFKGHSRWMIGKEMRTWVEPKAHLWDEAALTKKARLDLVKKGLLPPG